jgi:hypothetical protein
MLIGFSRGEFIWSPPTAACRTPSIVASGAVIDSVGFNHWYLYSSPAMAGSVL